MTDKEKKQFMKETRDEIIGLVRKAHEDMAKLAKKCCDESLDAALDRQIEDDDDDECVEDEQHVKNCVNWHKFLDEIKNLRDPFLYGVFSAIKRIHFDELDDGILGIVLHRHEEFIVDKLRESAKHWFPRLEGYFPGIQGLGLGVPELLIKKNKY